jgi:hypothetical protein
MPADVLEREENVVCGLIDCDGVGVGGESCSTEFGEGRGAKLEDGDNAALRCDIEAP